MKPRVLVVEDDPAMALLIRQPLVEAGFRVEEVERGRAALERLAADEGGVDLVVLDQNLPDITGAEVVAALGDRLRTLPVIVTTAHGGEDLAVTLLQAGAADYVRKDLDLAFVRDLPRKAWNALDRFALEAENRRLQDVLREANEALEAKVEERTAELEALADRLRADISARRRAEEALRESEARYRALFENAHDSIFLVDAETRRFLDVNQNAARRLGYRREEILELAVPDIAGPSVREKMSKLFARLEKEGALLFEYVHRRKNGSEIPVEISSQLLKVGRSRVILSVVRDITERRRAAERQVDLEAQLRQAQKMEAVGTLAGGLAHDFNNQLTGILGTIELARAHLGSPVVAEGFLEEAETAVLEAGELTHHLLSLSRRQAPVMRPVDLKQVVWKTAKLLERSLPASITLAVEADPRVPVLQADGTQLEQALLNLGINARDAMPEGGRLLLKTALVEETSDGETASEYAVLTVSDTGSGMASEVRERIFEPFFSTKPAGQGTGLGLAMVYACIDGHGGWIDVESTPGEGSTFRVHLPVVAPVAEGATEENGRAEGHETVLVVDDVASVRRTFQRGLEKMGYRVLIAGSVREALEVLAENDGICLVVTDLMMPERDGRALLADLRQRDYGMPVIACSGYASHFDTLVAEGFAAVVPKPCRASNLARTIRGVLDRD